MASLDVVRSKVAWAERHRRTPKQGDLDFAFCYSPGPGVAATGTTAPAPVFETVFFAGVTPRKRVLHPTRPQSRSLTKIPLRYFH